MIIEIAKVFIFLELKMDYDVVVIGAGVVGLACAYKLSSKNLSVLVVEKNKSFGMETSSRNSEVIHAGIYYPNNSLKAKLCVAGNKAIYQWCNKHNVPHSRIGKYIIATNQQEAKELERLYIQAMNNDVDNISRIPVSELKKIEPNIKAVAALWSPDTGIINSHLFMESLVNATQGFICDFAYQHTFLSSESNGESYSSFISDDKPKIYKISSKYVVNAAGLDADTIASCFGLDIERLNYTLRYSKGNYYKLKSNKKDIVNHLVYPIPEKLNNGLGIHLTKDLDGEVRLGPDSVFLDSRDKDYSVSDKLQGKFFDSVSKYLNGIEFDDIYPDQAGIRAKLKSDNGYFRDFIIQEEGRNRLAGLINLIGIDSPGLTSSLAIADMITDFICNY